MPRRSHPGLLRGPKVVDAAEERYVLDQIDARPRHALGDRAAEAQAFREPSGRDVARGPPAAPPCPRSTSAPRRATARTRSPRGTHERRNRRRLEHDGIPPRLDVPRRLRVDGLARGAFADRDRVDVRRRGLEHLGEPAWPPSPPLTTVLIDAIVEGDQQNCLGVGDRHLARDRLERSRGMGAPPGTARRGRRPRRRGPRGSPRPWPRRTDRPRTSACRASPGNKASGATTFAISSAWSAARRAPLDREVVRRRDADPVLLDHADAHAGVLAVGALVDRARGEPREPAPLVHEQNFDAVGVRQAERGVRDAARLVGSDHPGISGAPGTSSPSPRAARSGTAPATRRARRARPARAGPCRQFGVPQTVPLLPAADPRHDPQNSVVIPGGSGSGTSR